MYKATTFDDAVKKACKLIDDGGLGHTSSLYINTITEKEKQAFFKAQVARQTEDSYWFYDTTSISSYIELHIILGRKYSSGVLLNEYQQFS